jgi:hypothetical protein
MGSVDSVPGRALQWSAGKDQLPKESNQSSSQHQGGCGLGTFSVEAGGKLMPSPGPSVGRRGDPGKSLSHPSMAQRLSAGIS